MQRAITVAHSNAPVQRNSMYLFRRISFRFLSEVPFNFVKEDTLRNFFLHLICFEVRINKSSLFNLRLNDDIVIFLFVLCILLFTKVFKGKSLNDKYLCPLCLLIVRSIDACLVNCFEY